MIWTELGGKNELEIYFIVFIYLFTVGMRITDSTLLIMTFNVILGQNFPMLASAGIKLALVSRDFPWHTKGWLQGALQAVQPALGLKCCLPSRTWSFCPAVLTSTGTGSGSGNWGWSYLQLSLLAPAAGAMVHVGCRTIAPVYSPESSFHMGFYLKHWNINMYHIAMGKYCLAGAPFKVCKKTLRTLVTLIQASWKYSRNM